MPRVMTQKEIGAKCEQKEKEGRLIELGGMHGVCKIWELNTKKAVRFLAVAAACKKAADTAKAVRHQDRTGDDRDHRGERALQPTAEDEIDDKEAGNLIPNYYDIMDADNNSLGNSHEAILVRAQDFITTGISRLLLMLMMISSCVDSINKGIDPVKNHLKLTEHKKEFAITSERTDGLLSRTLIIAEDWKQVCSSNDLEKAKYYIDEIKEAKTELESCNKEFKDKISQVEIK